MVPRTRWASLSLVSWLGDNACQVKIDGHAEVDAALANGRTDSLVGVVAVLFRVADKDAVATPPNQLVQAHIVEVAAIGQVHILGGIVDAAQQFAQQPKRSKAGRSRGHITRSGIDALAGCRRTPRIGHPEAEAYIEHGHQEGRRRLGVVTPVRTERRPGSRHRRGHVGAAGIKHAGGDEAVEAQVFPPLGPAYCVAAIERGKGEGSRLALLPRQVFLPW